MNWKFIDLLLRYSLVGYFVYAIFSEQIYIFGYNIFLVAGLIGIALIIYETIQKETNKEPLDKEE